jgi:hypothetical protein
MSTHTPSGVLATGRTVTTGASIATSAAPLPDGSAALPDAGLVGGSGSPPALGPGEPADGVGRADREGCAERPDCDGCTRCGLPAIGSGVGPAAGGGGGGADIGTSDRESIVYVAWALLALGAEPFTMCAPDAPDGGVIVTLTEHVPLSHPG